MGLKAVFRGNDVHLLWRSVHHFRQNIQEQIRLLQTESQELENEKDIEEELIDLEELHRDYLRIEQILEKELDPLM